MLDILLILLALVGAGTHWLIRRKHVSGRQVVDLYFVYSLVFMAGGIGAVGFVSHVFFAEQTAKMIGWPPGNPFQFEVGFHDGAWALLGFLAIWLRGRFWLAIALGWSFFMLGAAGGHIHQAVAHGDYAAYNAGIIAPDFAVPLILLGLAYVKFVRLARRPAPPG